MISDLQKYTGRKISVDGSGTAWFAGGTSGDQYASQGDMDWIWRVQNDDSETDIATLWRHITSGDDWHRKRFSEAWAANSGQQTWWQAFDQGGTAGLHGFAEGATFGGYQAPEWARKTEGFNISRGIGMATTSIEVGLAGGGLAVGFNATASSATAFNAVTIMGVQGGIPMGMAEAAGGLALYGAATAGSDDAPNPTAAAQTAAVPVMNGMMQHLQTGKIYRVPAGQGNTPTGKPYVGRTIQPSPKARGSADGRDRSKAVIIDTYDPNNTMEGRIKEDNAIRKEGLENLDNRRYEIRRE